MQNKYRLYRRANGTYYAHHRFPGGIRTCPERFEARGTALRGMVPIARLRLTMRIRRTIQVSFTRARSSSFPNRP
jgi:hypothetical protein